jgi:hypothetical protein
VALDAIAVVILNVATQAAPPATHIEYEVSNGGSAPIWLVHDQWLLWNQDGSHIELSFQRGAMRPGSQVFGYFAPAVVKIESKAQFRETVELKWPVDLDPLWNKAAWARPQPGTYQVSVRVGYGLSAAPDAPVVGESVEAPVFRWQREAVSPAVPMTVPEY